MGQAGPMARTSAALCPNWMYESWHWAPVGKSVGVWMLQRPLFRAVQAAQAMSSAPYPQRAKNRYNVPTFTQQPGRRVSAATGMTNNGHDVFLWAPYSKNTTADMYAYFKGLITKLKTQQFIELDSRSVYININQELLQRPG